jgi:hypothetical protein
MKAVGSRGTPEGASQFRTTARAGVPRGQDGPSEDMIRQRAHQLYLSRASSGQPGDAVSDWLQAEREPRGKSSLR